MPRMRASVFPPERFGSLLAGCAFRGRRNSLALASITSPTSRIWLQGRSWAATGAPEGPEGSEARPPPPTCLLLNGPAKHPNPPPSPLRAGNQQQSSTHHRGHPSSYHPSTRHHHPSILLLLRASDTPHTHQRNNRARPGSRASRIQGQCLTHSHRPPSGLQAPPLVILASALPWLQCRPGDSQRAVNTSMAVA